MNFTIHSLLEHTTPGYDIFLDPSVPSSGLAHSRLSCLVLTGIRTRDVESL